MSAIDLSLVHERQFLLPKVLEVVGCYVWKYMDKTVLAVAVAFSTEAPFKNPHLDEKFLKTLPHLGESVENFLQQLALVCLGTTTPCAFLVPRVCANCGLSN